MRNNHLEIRGLQLSQTYDANALIVAGVSGGRALATGKGGEGAHRLADALVALGDPADLLAHLNSVAAGKAIDEYVAGGNACFIVVRADKATVYFETASDDEEYPFEIGEILLAVKDWQRAWNGAAQGR